MNLKTVIESFDDFHQAYKEFRENIEGQSYFDGKEDLLDTLDITMQELYLHNEALNAKSELGICEKCATPLTWTDDVYCRECES